MEKTERVSLAKSIIKENIGKFITVDVLKKDGTLRHMVCHKSKVLEASCTGGNPEATAKRKATLAATDKLCVEEMLSDKTFQFRTINLDTVQRIAAGGHVYDFTGRSDNGQH